MTEEKENAIEKIDEESAGRILDTIYEKTLVGIPKVSRPVDDLADDYISKSSSPEEAAKKLAAAQIAKCGTPGFITGLGGLITLPVAIPANLSSVLYMQMRMIAAIAKIGGYDLKSDQVQTLTYICLTGSAASNVVKETSIKIGEKTLESAIEKIPGSTLTKINQKIGGRILTKFGEKGAINLGKMIPLAGGVIGGSFDAVSTAAIASNAIRIFIKHEDISQPCAPSDGEHDAAQEPRHLSDIGDAALEGAQEADRRIVSGAQSVGSAIVAGAQAAGDALGKGAQAASEAVADGAKNLGNAANGAVQAIGGFFGSLGKKQP